MEDVYGDPAGPAWAQALSRVLTGHLGPPLAFQPIVDLARGVVVGYEALSRFPGPPVAAPDRWFAAAAAHGVAAELEARSLCAALDARRRLPRDCFLTINVSPSLLPSPVLLEPLLSGGDLRGIFLELTEHVPVDDLDELVAVLARLRAAGAAIALDDAGSGYSGLALLARVRPELVKLDRSLVDQIDRDEAKLALAELLGEFAGRLDGWLLAEGVERPEELAALLRLGVPLGQGWLFGRPGPPWPGLDAAATDLFRRVPGPRGGSPAPDGGRRDEIRALVSPPVVRPLADAAGAHAVLLSEPELDHGVLVDGRGRPLRVLVRRGAPGPDAAVHDSPVGLRMTPDTPLHDAARRAAARPAALRYDPVVCTDTVGRLLGTVTVGRLLQHLAGAGPASRTGPGADPRASRTGPAADPPASRTGPAGDPPASRTGGAVGTSPGGVATRDHPKRRSSAPVGPADVEAEAALPGAASGRRSRGEALRLR